MTPAQLTAYITARSVEEGDCLLWQGSCTGAGIPNISCKALGGKGLNLRRLIARDVLGLPIEGRRIVSVCGDARCVRLEHIRALKQEQFVAWQAKICGPQSAAAVASRTLGRRSWSKINAATAARIRQARAAGDTYAVIAAREGISKSTVGYIVRGETWRDAQSSPFAQLLQLASARPAVKLAA